MGRSRAAKDTSLRQPKNRRISDILENTDTGTFIPGVDDVKKTFCNCSYCYKDISGKIRIKCAVCSDFYLCVECFSVGAEVQPHKNNHPYRIMDTLAFPFFCAEWNVDEEIILLEGLEIYGPSNWSKVAEHVGTKSKSQCVDHYNMMYMNSPCFPLPDMSYVLGNNKQKLQAMVREVSEINEAPSTSGEVDGKEVPQFSASIKSENQGKEGAVRLSSSSNTPSEAGHSGGFSCGNMPSESGKSASAIKVEDFQDELIGEQKPKISGGKGVFVKELFGYNSKREDFEIEYDNDAETILADMEFKDSDTDTEHFLKRQMLHAYNRRLDERKQRKDFVLDRNLLISYPSEKDLTLDERELSGQLKVFTRFHSKEKHDELLRSVIEERRILKRIEDLQEARAAGCVTSSEAERYIEQKRKKEMEEKPSQGGPDANFHLRDNRRKGEKRAIPGLGIKSHTISHSGEKSTSTPAGLIGLGVSEKWSITGFPGADELSEDEKQLCGDIRILPIHYLNMVQTMTTEISNGNVTKSSDAHTLFKVDPEKIDKVFHMLIRKGIVLKHE
ncbi:transcriptional adapter ADA2b-like isoform X2 [Primulina huaijiensis]|uniref:transcriptional adapter ADA2b-like isoform X2 n=1 Tax=Primulina huaijiensis TaxID=1492673 RepID=UPI003CC7766D